MSTIMPVDLSAIQDQINTLVNNDADTPDSDDEEWTARLNLIYLAIRNWENQDIEWNELFTTYTHGDTLSGTTSYTLTFTNYRKPTGLARLTLNDETGYVPFIKPSQARIYIDGGGKAVYLTGNNISGWTLHLTWTPASGDGTYGATLAFDYYKYATKPTLTTDEVEMSDPNYIVYWVAAQKSLLESQNNKYSVYDALATEALDNMRVENDANPTYNDNKIEDIDALNGSVLGE